MRKSTPALLTVFFVLAMALGGCKGEKPIPQQDDSNTRKAEEKPISKVNRPQPVENLSKSQKDSLEILSTIPSTPAVLKLGEKMRVKIRYNLVSADKAHIWAVPFINGRNNIFCGTHPSYGHEAGNGEIEGWFLSDEATKVDEVRVTMVVKDSRKLLATASLPIEAEWK